MLISSSQILRFATSALLLAALCLTISTCDTPTKDKEGEGQPCTSEGTCPADLVCVESANRCASPQTPGRTIVSFPKALDILFVLDNSGSMIGEQRQLAATFQRFAEELEANLEKGYQLGVVTTAMESRASDAVVNDQGQPLLGCPLCSILPEGTAKQSCINSSGETGRLQTRLGKNTGTDDIPEFDFVEDPTCRIVTAANKNCFFDPDTQRGLMMVGYTGCGYEKGLAAMRSGLEEWAESYNQGFIRPEAALAVVLLSDEDDCGAPGDVMESTDARGDICYYAARGYDLQGNTTYTNPNNGQVLPYQLTPVQAYYDFLMGLKGNQAGMVKFAAIVGLIDRNDPYTTTADKIEFVELYPGIGRVKPACSSTECTGKYCSALPGTRFVELARLFGNNGFVDSICQTDFTDTMVRIAKQFQCPDRFVVTEPIAEPETALLLINGEPVPRTSCSVEDALLECMNLGEACPQGGTCVETWSYAPLAGSETEGVISFAARYNPCTIFEGKSFMIEVSQ